MSRISKLPQKVTGKYLLLKSDTGRGSMAQGLTDMLSSLIMEYRLVENKGSYPLAISLVYF